jgi:hypothetical protein
MIASYSLRLFCLAASSVRTVLPVTARLSLPSVRSTETPSEALHADPLDSENVVGGQSSV